MGKKTLLKLDNVDLIGYGPLRTNPNMRATFDFGEVSSEVAKTLHECRMMGSQKLTVIIMETDDLEEISKEDD